MITETVMMVLLLAFGSPQPSNVYDRYSSGEIIKHNIAMEGGGQIKWTLAEPFQLLMGELGVL